MLQQYIKERIEKFDKQFPLPLNQSSEQGGYDARPYIHDFHNASLTGLVEKIEKWAEENRLNPTDIPPERIAEYHGHNDVLSDLESLLDTLKK